ncbi:MAG TPA: GSCFA domain-containing protein [Flavobacterium sp.]|nr:GSCFA domain-containing protein [Flavobacterium sp.]
MNFTTKIPLNKSQNPISYNSNILLLGSCFAESMALKFEYFKFKNTTNPLGIIFNPVSIEKLIHRAVHEIEFSAEDIFYHNNLWHCFEVHSMLSNPSSEALLQQLNSILHIFKTQIKKATHVVITYGTSWVYKNNCSKDIVANCHKVPQNQFTKEILSIKVIEQSMQNSIALIKKCNPNCAFIFTISPVRHIKDGFVENTRSKAHLISALHSIKSKPHFFSYFPSFEIMMDELRDYRFYAQDMLHPSQTAIDYIWKCFSENYISTESQKIMTEVDDIQKSLLHKPFKPNSENHQMFLNNLNKKIKHLQKEIPYIAF